MKQSPLRYSYLGCLLAIALAGVGSYFGYRYVYTQVTALPPRPVFEEELPKQAESQPAATEGSGAEPAASQEATPPSESQTQKQPEVVETPSESASSTSSQPAPTAPQPTPEEKAQPEDTQSLEAGAFEARVTWPEGLALRGNPSYSASRVGGIDHNGEVIVLEESADGVWQRVRIVSTGKEGWVKAGNVERINP